MSTPLDPRYALMLEEARRSLDQQKADLEGLRGRASGAIGLGFAAAAFLVGLKAPSADFPPYLLGGGLIALAVACGFALHVLWFHTMRLTRDVAAIDSRIGAGEDSDTLVRSVASGIQADVTANDRVLRWLHLSYASCVLALLTEVGLLLAGIAKG